MDNQNSAVADIPNFKLAKVGKDRERKRGGAGWLGGQGAGSGFSGALGGSGSGLGGFFGTGMSAFKAILMMALAGSLSMGAWMVGSRMNGSDSASKGGQKLFSDKGSGQYADTSNVIKADNSIPNSLGYVSGSTDGLTPEERAKKQAEADAARKAAEDAKAKADADASKQAAAAAPAAAPEPTVAAPEIAKKALTAGKFGQMNSSFGGGGGGLSGGAGLSGGINRNFGGATGLGSGIKPQNGALSSFHNAGKPGMSSVAHAAGQKSKSQGFAKQQLDNAFAQSRQATAGGAAETSAATAAQPFDNNPALGSTIDGPGVNNGAQTGAADGGTPNNPSTGGDGGPLAAEAACGSGQEPDASGTCQNISTPGSVDASPYQKYIELAEGLMVLVALLSLWCMMAKALPIALVALQIILTVLGAAIAAIGVYILSQYHQTIVGGILSAVGAWTAVSAWVMPTGSPAQIAQMCAGELIGSVVGLMGAAMGPMFQ